MSQETSDRATAANMAQRQPRQSQNGRVSTLYYDIYNLGLLPLYDLLVLKISCTLAWRCPTSTYLLPFFRKHMSRNHLDLGVGTGYFPATVLSELQHQSLGATDFHPSQADREKGIQQVTLWDLSQTALKRTKLRIGSVAPAVQVEVVEADCLTEPANGLVTDRKFDSVSAINLLHCIPAPASEKAVGLFATAHRHLSPDGVFFGCTLLGDVERRKSRATSTAMDWVGCAAGQHGRRDGDGLIAPKFNVMGWFLMWAYNRAGIFTNWKDGPDDFTLALGEEFESVETWIVGRMLVFRARQPRKH